MPAKGGAPPNRACLSDITLRASSQPDRTSAGSQYQRSRQASREAREPDGLNLRVAGQRPREQADQGQESRERQDEHGGQVACP